MAGKVGSASFALYVDGYDLLIQKAKGFTWKASALNEDTTGLGDTFHAVTPVGLMKVEVSQSGAFFDDSTNAVHALLTPVAITSNTLANPSVVTTPVPHGLTTGDSISIAGVITSDPTINGTRIVTVLTALTFSVPVNVTTGGTGGYFTLTSGLTKQQTSRILVAGYAGNTIGQPAFGASGVYAVNYEALSQVGALTKANVTYDISGTFDKGVVLNAAAAKTADWNTKTDGAQVDSGASSAFGGVGYQVVSAMSGFTGFVGKIRDSSDDITYADLITFTNVTAAPKAERVTNGVETVDRYLSFNGDVTGSGSINVFVVLSRLTA